jgi:hypothetical protein
MSPCRKATGDGEILSAVLQVFTRYSANNPQFPVNDRSLFTGVPATAKCCGRRWGGIRRRDRFESLRYCRFDSEQSFASVILERIRT